MGSDFIESMRAFLLDMGYQIGDLSNEEMVELIRKLSRCITKARNVEDVLHRYREDEPQLTP